MVVICVCYLGVDSACLFCGFDVGLVLQLGCIVIIVRLCCFFCCWVVG